MAHDLAGVILAAGKGTRMKSDLPKCLHSVCGLPMAEHIGRTMRSIGISQPVIVIGHGGEMMQEVLGHDRYAYAWQREQLGTAHAVMMAVGALKNHQGPVLVTPGDVPLLSEDALGKLVALHRTSGAQATIGTCILSDASGYGRIVRDADGKITGIVEHKDATPAQREIREINSAVYCFDCQTLLRILPTLNNHNSQSEFYLTDVIETIAREGGLVEGLIYEDFHAFQGVNDRWQLAESAATMRTRILRRHAESGVSIIDPGTTHIDADVAIGEDTVVYPMTQIEGLTTIGAACRIGPQTVIVSCEIGDECTVLMSHANRAKMESGSKCGPFAHLRPKTKIGRRAKIGNFVEIKNATIHEEASISHLSYIGDADVGARTNIGAGTITCNYDGIEKHRTVIGEDVFVGSNSTLVAPVTLGDGSFIAAGSAITVSVDAGSLALGRARQVEKEGWASQRRTKDKSNSTGGA